MVFRMIGGITAAVVLFATTAHAGTHSAGVAGYTLPADKPVTVVIMRPDVTVSQLQTGGLAEPNADWTSQARVNIAKAFGEELASRKINFRMMDDRLGTGAASDAEERVAQYSALHESVAVAILAQKFGLGADKLPSKRDDFRYTLGPQAHALADLSGANYGLFVETIDEFSSAGRKTTQAIGALGCLIGACVIIHGGVHDAYVSLVDLQTGEVVWFNLARGSQGDVRQEDGARSLAKAVLSGMPSRPGEAISGGVSGG